MNLATTTPATHPPAAAPHPAPDQQATAEPGQQAFAKLDQQAFAKAVAAGSSIGLYLHIPFCEKKCPYCDFNTYAGLGTLFDATVDALCSELARWAEPLRTRSVATIFVGGGTPTVLSSAQLQRLFAAVHTHLTLAPDAEISCEANPGTVDRAKFHTLRALGVNRLSLGVQSMNPHELAFLGRIHGVDDVNRAVDAARAAGFDNLNLDFIFGLPGQEASSWAHTLDAALALQTEHLSLYSLIVEEETPLFHWVERGRVQPPDEDVAADLYELSMERLGAAGYAQYEVSNWARRRPGEAADVHLPQLAGRHNLLYWLNGEYLGIGPGAHSHLRSLPQAPGAARRSRRWGNRKPVPGYVKRMAAGESVDAFAEEPDARTAMGETMMVGLRLLHHGVPHAHFAALHGSDPRTLFGAEIAALDAQGLLHCSDDRLHLTQRGLLLGNQVFARFLPEPGAPPPPLAS